MNILECQDLTKEYLSGENVIKAVDNVTAAFEEGEFCAVTGPSGSGKSTLLHLLSSLENPTSGTVTYSGKPLSSYNDNQLSILRRRRFGFVFQAYNLVQELTGYENIVLPVMLDRRKPDEAYLQNWESRLKAQTEKSHGETAAGCDSEKKARGETANTPEARIADFRAKIAERKTATGKDYLSFYYLEASSYEIQE